MTPPQKQTLKTMSIGGATFDLFVHTDHSVVHEMNGMPAFTLPLGTKIRVQGIEGQPGGGACNTSTGLSRLGCSAYFCGIMGSDQWGQNLLAAMKKQDVNTDYATIVDGETSSFSILLVASNGERVTLYEPGTNTHLDKVTFAREAAATMDWIVLNHLNRESCEIEDDVVEMLTTIQGPGLTWNPGGCQIERGLHEKQNEQLLAHTTILLVNTSEAMQLTGVSTMDEALYRLSAAGPRFVCITDGANGSYATDGEMKFFCPALPCDLVDTTGAGDAFGTGFTWAIASGRDLPTALKAGTINAKSVVSAIGAQPGLLTHTEMQSQIDQSSLQVDVTAL